MANTYTLIAKEILASAQATITFSNIPSIYTDLILKCSARNDETGVTIQQMNIAFDTNVNSAHSRTQIDATGAAAGSSRGSNLTQIQIVDITPGPLATSNTFSNVELYIPSYTASRSKPLLADSAGENNSTTAGAGYRIITSGLWRNNNSISTILLSSGGGNFTADSSFYLYGIKNA